jgi:hypothetical protein
MGGMPKLSEKPMEFRDVEAPGKSAGALALPGRPEAMMLAAPMLSDFGIAYNDTDPSPGGTDFAPAGAANYFADFSQFADRLVDTVSHVTPAELYHAVEGGAFRFLEKSAPNFGGLGGLVSAGLDVFADLQIPGSGRLFSRNGKSEFLLGKGTNIGFDRVTSSVMQPKHVKISEDPLGLKFEDVSGASSSIVWIGEKVPGTERTEWKRLKSGFPYQPKGEGMIQVAVGPISLNDEGVPVDFKGAEHFGINGQKGERRIFRME